MHLLFLIPKVRAVRKEDSKEIKGKDIYML